MTNFDDYLIDNRQRMRYLFANGVELSLVHLFPGEDNPYEAYVVGGDEDVLETLAAEYPYAFPIEDVMRYDAYGVAELVSRMMKQCDGLEQVYFHPSERQYNPVDGGV